jgi:acylphosphatase
MSKARARVIVSGYVQGVFFRANTIQTAHECNLTGWVRNRWDGKVEAVFEGEQEDIKSALSWCHKGPPGAMVQKVDVKWEQYKGEFDSFNIAR